MNKQTKFITSHKFRVKKAESVRRSSPEKISFFDREAYVEFYLLEDIVRLYEWRLANEKENLKKVETRAGLMSKKRNIEKFTAIIDIFKSAIEIAWSAIESGNYKAVWSSIPEQSLMTAAKNVKYLPQLRDLAIKLLRNLSDEALDATAQSAAFDSALDEIEDHEANVRTMYDLPSEQEIEEIIKTIKIAIPDTRTKDKPTIKIN